jgi:hypothetical protein
MKTCSISFLVILLLTACNFINYGRRDISEFRIDHSALAYGETIRIIYCSGGPYNNKPSFYYHLIAVGGKNDTVNLLVQDISSLDIKNTPPEKVFISSESESYALLQRNGELKPGENYEKLKPVKFDKVISNRKFKDIEENNYPTVIGLLGETVENLPDEVMDMLPDDAKENIKAGLDSLESANK